MVVLESSTPSTVYDIVFIVEGTANVGAYFDSLKSQYILPTLEYFNGGTFEEVDYGSSSNCTLYTLVTFHGSDRAPSSLSTCLEPTTSAHEFQQSLDKIDFASGYGDTASHMAEGISTALQLLDDLQKLREPHTKTIQHCILICNSTPYALPSNGSLNYSGHMTENLVKQLSERGVNFSIVSPRKIPILYQLFDIASNDPSVSSANAKNYTTDSRHLVLLNGYQLQEHPLSPSATKQEPVFPDVKVTQIATTSKMNNMPGVARPTLTGPRPNPGPVMPIKLVDAKAPRMPNPTLVHPNQQQPPQMHPMESMPGGIRPPGGGMGNLGVRPNIPGGFVPPENPNMQMQASHNPGMMVNMPDAALGGAGPNNPFAIDINNPAAALSAAAMQQQQRLIWAGALDWQEKPKTGEVGPRLNRSLQCQIFVPAEDMEINASNWVNRMTMNLIPSALLSPLSSLFKNSRTVNFQFGKQDSESLSSLYRVMANGFGGCIHIQTVTNAPASQTDVRVLMLLFSQRKHQFMGLIPTDQSRFVQGIRTVINKHKQQQERSKMQGAVGGAPGFNVPQPVGATAVQQVSSPMGGGGGGGGGSSGIMTTPMAVSQGGMNIPMPMMPGGQVQHNQQLQQQIQHQQQQQGAAGNLSIEEERRNNMMQFQLAEQRQQHLQQQQQQQFIVQQQQQQHHQQQRFQQQQQLQQQLQSMQGNQQPLRHLLQQQQLVRHQHQQLMMQQQQQQQQQQQLRVRLPGGPQGHNSSQQGMQPGLGPMQPGQNFGPIVEDYEL